MTRIIANCHEKGSFPLLDLVILETLNSALPKLRFAPDYIELWRKYGIWCAKHIVELMDDHRSINAVNLVWCGKGDISKAKRESRAAWDAAFDERATSAGNINAIMRSGELFGFYGSVANTTFAGPTEHLDALIFEPLDISLTAARVAVIAAHITDNPEAVDALRDIVDLVIKLAKKSHLDHTKIEQKMCDKLHEIIVAGEWVD